jgi:RNA polymerase sigma factor (sigma-70 family)
MKLSDEARQFYERVFEPARNGCMRELRKKGCSEDLAEDIFSTALLKVIDGAGDLMKREFSAPQMVNYLKAACRTSLIDHHRHRRVLTEVGLDKAGPLSDASAALPDEVAEDRATVTAARKAIDGLPERERLIFCQRNLMDRSPEEIQQSFPALTSRAYRRILQHANAHAFEMFDRIEAG